MQKKLPELSKTEWNIMNICWKKGRVSARVIYEETLLQKQRGYQTVKTMLDRLVEKGYLRREKFGPIWLYAPTIARSAVMAREIETFVGTVLDNTLTPLFVHFARKEKLSREELDELRKLIEENEEKGNDKP
ncbi:MAG: BlaI/MecI/CopY family transcriptional regulator [Candidatus Latescibacterota bacterium]|jgi:BlaI family transcriptional regulator, penicillinase repressor